MNRSRSDAAASSAISLPRDSCRSEISGHAREMQARGCRIHNNICLIDP